MFSPSMSFPNSVIQTPNPRTAVALDAADGRIDGRYFGRRIGVAPASPVAAAGYSQAVALDMADGRLDGRYFGRQIGVAPASPVAAAGYSQAVALDMADGRLDGRYFGRQIVAPSASVVGATSYNHAAALDMADGRLDGKYFGNQIAVTAPRTYPMVAPQPVAVAVPPPPPAVVVQAPPQVQIQEKVVMVPGPVQYVYKEVPVYVEVVKEVPGPERVVQVRVEVPGPVEVRYVEKQVPGPERIVSIPSRPISITPKPKPVSRPASMMKTTTVKESYKVSDLNVAINLSTSDGTDDGEYQGRPIMVAGHGLLTDIYIANSALNGAELRTILQAGYPLKAVTVHSTRRAKVVFCLRDIYIRYDKVVQVRSPSLPPMARDIVTAFKDLLADDKVWVDMFKYFDSNKDGKLSPMEVKHLLKWVAARDTHNRFPWLTGDQAVQTFMTTFDANNDGAVDPVEFLWYIDMPRTHIPFQLVQGHSSPTAREVLKAMSQTYGRNMGSAFLVFSTFDDDKNGQLSLTEMEQLITGLAVYEPKYGHFRTNYKSLAKEVMKAVDRDGSGTISFTEFLDICHPRLDHLWGM